MIEGDLTTYGGMVDKLHKEADTLMAADKADAEDIGAKQVRVMSDGLV